MKHLIFKNGRPFSRMFKLTDDDEGSGSGYKRPTVAEVKEKYADNPDLMARQIISIEGDNFSTREKLRTAKVDLDTVTQRLPKDGTVVLSKEQSELFEAYKAQGTLEVVKGLKEQNESLLSDKKKAEDFDKVKEAADNVAPGVKFKATVLQDQLGKLKDAEVKLIDKDIDGVKSKVVLVTYKDEKGVSQETELNNLAKTHPLLKDYYPSLLAIEGDFSTDQQFPVQFDGDYTPPKTQMPSMAGQIIGDRYSHHAPKATNA